MLHANQSNVYNSNTSSTSKVKDLCSDFNLAMVCIPVPVFIDLYEFGLSLSLPPLGTPCCPQKCYSFYVHYGPPYALHFIWMCKNDGGLGVHFRE